uniref:Uncharacterized protein n=1 Tax=Lactuca sativa TaxID=4236 RepID=A0A9R1V1L8_LACSA|nr:hypothetical protein LSAT_V11C700353760 [Lactuca sativa]
MEGLHIALEDAVVEGVFLGAPMGSDEGALWIKIVKFCHGEGGGFLDDSRIESGWGVWQKIVGSINLHKSGCIPSNSIHRCSVVGQVWSRVGHWFHLDLPVFSSIHEVVDWVDFRPTVHLECSIVESVFIVVI